MGQRHFATVIFVTDMFETSLRQGGRGMKHAMRYTDLRMFINSNWAALLVSGRTLE